MTSFSLNFDAAKGKPQVPARASDKQSSPTGGDFVATLAALWFVAPPQIPPVQAEAMHAKSEAATGAQAEPANAASLLDGPKPPSTRDLSISPLTDGVPDALAPSTGPGGAPNSEDPLIGRPVDSNPTIHPLPPQRDAVAFSISNTMADVMSKLKARVAATEPAEATTEPGGATAAFNDAALDQIAFQVNPAPATAATIAITNAIKSSGAAGPFDAAAGATIQSPTDESLRDMVPDAPLPPTHARPTRPPASEEPLIGRPVDESLVPRLQPRHVNGPAAQAGEKLAGLGGLGALISMASEQAGAAISASQESFTQSKPRQRPVEPDNTDGGQTEKAAPASLLEKAFRELVGDGMADSRPASHPLKADWSTLSAAGGGAGSTADNPRPFDHTTQTNAGSLALGANNSAELRAATTAAAGSTSAALSQQILHPMVEMARSLAQRQTRTLRIQLRPDQFGQIDLKLTRDASGRLSAHLTAESAVTRHALAEDISSLRETLEQCGLLVDHLDVSLALDAGGKAGSQTAGDDEAGSAKWPMARPFASTVSAADDAQPAKRIEPRRLLNLQI